LFSTILVGVSGVPSGWGAVQEAIRFAAHEGGHVVGLHIVADASAAKEAVVGEIRAEFERRCAEAGIAERWLVEQGSISLRICAWSRWVDLTVVPLNHPPGDQPIARLSSGLTSLIEHCATPILAVPRALPALERVLLAYDGSPKSREALFVSAYLAGQWDVELVVVTVTDQVETEPATLAEARAYLERHDIAAEYASAKGHVGENILAQVEKWQCDLVVMGGYGFSPPLEIMLGSAVDQVLRKSQQPVLICR
jgi:nucleotide-binding universal stress UspA family protein